MKEAMEIRTERVDDIPILLSEMKEMGIAEAIDKSLKVSRRWQGLSMGKVAMVWLSYILSQGDHRKSHVEGWAGERLNTLSHCMGEEIRSTDFNDDRLSDILNVISNESTWAECEQRLNERSLRVYNLEPKIVRIDTSTASSYGRVDEQGMLQFGHSKDHRPDLPQVKIASSSLDPLGMPVVTAVLSGEKADDPVYLPIVTQVQERLGTRGLLYVGDSKMGSKATRAGIAGGGDYYLCPLGKVQLSEVQLSAYLEQQQDAKGDGIGAEGFELEVECSFRQDDGSDFSWLERRLLVKSDEQAQAHEKRLEKNLTQAQFELTDLTRRCRGKVPIKSYEELSSKVAKILKRYAVRDLLNVVIKEKTQTKQVRAYGAKPTRIETNTWFELVLELDEDALANVKACFGWRVFVTNQTAALLPFDKAVRVYRKSYLHEHGYSRLKGKPLSLSPMYLQRDDQIIGLVHLLSIALRVLTCMEFVLRRSLAKCKELLMGLYAGNPKRKTARPRTELLLAAFTNITLTIISLADELTCHLTDLSPLQQSILRHLGFDDSLYTRLTKHSVKLGSL